MIALIILGCILLFLIFLLSVKVRLSVTYREEISLTLRVLGIRIYSYPKKHRKGPRKMSAKKAARIKAKLLKKRLKKNEASRQKAAQKEADKLSRKDTIDNKLSNIIYTVDLIRVVAAKLIKKFFKHIRIDVTRLKITVASEDAATTAVAYGALTQSINILMPILKQAKGFKPPKPTELDVQIDYLCDTPSADIKLCFSLRVWQILDVALSTFIKFIIHTVKHPKPEGKKAKSDKHKVGSEN